MDNRPIGVFDSGLGGLTVLREIIDEVPNENILFFGDTARFPYGPRQLSEVRRFAISIANFLYNQNVKLLVVACNTATASALPDIRAKFDIPVIGVVEPGARSAVAATFNKRIGVIATEGTVESKAYDNAIKNIDEKIKLFSVASPLLVEYVEEGILEGNLLSKTICDYLKPLFKKNIDVLILGCTHFPLIEGNIKDCCDGGIKVINSAIETSRDVKNTLAELNIENDGEEKPQRVFYETGNVSKFFSVGRMFLGEKIKEVIKVDLEILV
ncbi:MAG: glutamate racemase [Actinomycetota bacterium]|nr:glutamate racemase [Actinomycetota bacterium]